MRRTTGKKIRSVCEECHPSGTALVPCTMYLCTCVLSTVCCVPVVVSAVVVLYLSLCCLLLSVAVVLLVALLLLLLREARLLSCWYLVSMFDFHVH